MGVNGLHAIAIVLTGREPLVMGGPQRECGNFEKKKKQENFVLLGTEPQAVLPVAKSLYLLTVLFCLCVH